MIGNEFLKKFFFCQNLFGGSTFPPLVKAKNQLKIFEKHLKQKRCTIRLLNFQNFCYYSKKKSGCHGE